MFCVILILYLCFFASSSPPVPAIKLVRWCVCMHTFFIVFYFSSSLSFDFLSFHALGRSETFLLLFCRSAHFTYRMDRIWKRSLLLALILFSYFGLSWPNLDWFSFDLWCTRQTHAHTQHEQQADAKIIRNGIGKRKQLNSISFNSFNRFIWCLLFFSRTICFVSFRFHVVGAFILVYDFCFAPLLFRFRCVSHLNFTILMWCDVFVRVSKRVSEIEELIFQLYYYRYC